MGMIQNSLNQLSASILGLGFSVGRTIKQIKNGFTTSPGKTEEPSVNYGPTVTLPDNAYTPQMGNIGSVYSTFAAINSGNDMISQKARVNEAVKARFEAIKKKEEE